MRVGKWGQRKAAFLFPLTDVACLTAGICSLRVCKEEEVAVTCLRRLVDIAAEELALIIGDVGVFGGKCVPLTSSRASNLVFPCQLPFERNSAFIFSDLSSSSYSVNTDSVSKYSK